MSHLTIDRVERKVGELSRTIGNGLINETLRVSTVDANTPDYILQRINNAIFTDVDLLQHNIELVTDHIRHKLMENGYKACHST